MPNFHAHCCGADGGGGDAGGEALILPAKRRGPQCLSLLTFRVCFVNVQDLPESNTMLSLAPWQVAIVF